MLLIITATILVDIVGVLTRIWAYFLSGHAFNLRTFWTEIVRGKPRPLRVHSPSTPYSPFEDVPELGRLVEDPETYESETRYPGTTPPRHSDLDEIDLLAHTQSEKEHTGSYGHRARASYMRHSYHSEQSTSSTLHEEDVSARMPFSHLPRLNTSLPDKGDGEVDEVDDFDVKLHARQGKWTRCISMGVYLTEWLLVGLAFAELLSGVSVYSGICHGHYINGCLAHFISESPFLLRLFG